MNLAIVYLASPRAWGWLKWSRLDCLKASLKLVARFMPGYPVVIFHEDYTCEDELRLYKAYVGAMAPIQLVKVDFSTHENLYRPGYRSERVGTYGYGMMCRFFSGVMQAHPALDGFTHYMRLDDDSYILSDMAQVIPKILDHDYTYRTTFEDRSEGFWPHVFQFMLENHLPVPAQVPNLHAVPYTNYHTSSLRLWKHPIVKSFTDSIEAVNGGITMGWDDALVQGAIARFLCPALGFRVRVEDGFCYRHNQHCSHRAGHGHGELCKDGNDAHHKGAINQQWGPPVL
jgi:hypothetical protein